MITQLDKTYMGMAQIWATNSKAKRKQVGCLIVKDRTIIADGYNGTPSGMDNTCENENNETYWYVLHAESNALMKLAQSTQSSKGATMYLTFSPCKNCSKLILQAGIARVVYSEKHSCQEGLEFLIANGIEVEQMEKTTVQQEFIKELNKQEDPTGFTFKAFEAGWNNKKKQFELCLI